MVGHEPGVGHPHITEVPGLLGDAGEGLFCFRVPLDEAVVRRRPAEGPAHPGVREVRPDEVDVVGGTAQVHGQAGLVLTAPGEGHILPGEGFTLRPEGVVPNLLLLGLAAPAGHRDDGPRPPHRLDAGGQKPGGPALHEDVRVAPVRGGQFQLFLAPDGVGGVDQDEEAGVYLVPGEGDGLHASTPSSRMRVTRLVKLSPAAFIMLG